MEDEAHAQFGSPAEPEDVAVVSIAISLKRIADVIEGLANADSESVGRYIIDVVQRVDKARP